MIHLLIFKFEERKNFWHSDKIALFPMFQNEKVSKQVSLSGHRWQDCETWHIFYLLYWELV